MDSFVEEVISGGVSWYLREVEYGGGDNVTDGIHKNSEKRMLKTFQRKVKHLVWWTEKNCIECKMLKDPENILVCDPEGPSARTEEKEFWWGRRWQFGGTAVKCNFLNKTRNDQSNVLGCVRNLTRWKKKRKCVRKQP